MNQRWLILTLEAPPLPRNDSRQRRLCAFLRKFLVHDVRKARKPSSTS
jgi:hypothetical protein